MGREELKAKLMEDAEQIIDEMLRRKPDAEAILLSDIEELAVSSGHSFRETVLENLVDESQEAEPEKEVACPRCGKRAYNKGPRPKTVITTAGETRLERDYYHCGTCRAGFFPLDKRWGLTRSAYSPNCAQQMVWLSGWLPYEHCQAVFGRIGGIHIPSSSIWRRTQTYGERLKACVIHEQQAVSLELTKIPGPHEDHDHRKGISMDGGMVNIRDEGWKEVKVGTVFDIDLHLERDQDTHELVERAHGINMAYTAVLGTTQQFGPALWSVAVAHQVPTAADSNVTADGADWIWNLADDYFPDSVQIIDWYHAAQHLAKASKARYPTDETKAQRWFKRQRTSLFQGQVDKIIRSLTRHDCADVAHYFQVHRRRMRYQLFQEEGYPIGSGTVESGVKQFKMRLTGPGMRWSRPTAERMLDIRAAVLQGNFDDLWHRAA